MADGTGRRGLLTPSMVLGSTIGAGLILIAVIAPLLLDDAANSLSSDAGLPPSAEHWLGTDNFGRDNLARALYATRLTLIMTVSATAIAVGGGIALGVGIWLSTGRFHRLGLRLLETAVAYPSMIFALVVASILTPGVASSVIAIGLAGIPGFARLTANLAAKISFSEYVTTARLLGVSPWNIARRHILPNMAEPILILTTTVLALSLVELSALSFIGLGVQPPSYDFGRLLNDSLDQIYTQPIVVVGPSVMIVLAGLSAMLLGDALAARANPRGNVRAHIPPRKRPAAAVVGDEALVRVEDLTIAVPGGAELVRGVSFAIAPGEVVALVGESGSGKSLTAMAIAGLSTQELAVTAKVLRVGKMDMLGRPDRGRLAREIAVVYQDPGTTFNPSSRMGTQLTQVMRTHQGVKKRVALARMADAMEQVNIRESSRRLRQFPHELSGGMRQRAMIATSIVTEPKLMVADEPTTALDMTVQLDVLRQFRTIHQQQGTAMLFITHDLAVAEALSDSILVMKDGRIVERLTPDELTDRRAKHPYTQNLLAAVPAIKLNAGSA